MISIVKNKLNPDDVAMVLADFMTDGELSSCDRCCEDCPLSITLNIEIGFEEAEFSICDLLQGISSALSEEV